MSRGHGLSVTEILSMRESYKVNWQASFLRSWNRESNLVNEPSAILVCHWLLEIT